MLQNNFQVGSPNKETTTNNTVSPGANHLALDCYISFEPMENYSDKQLGDLLTNNNAKAYRLIYSAYSRRVMGFALTLTKERAEAEDLTQETFVAAFCGGHGFRQESRLLAWILGICLRRWRDRKRRYSPVMEQLIDQFDRLNATEGKTLEHSVIDRLNLLTALDHSPYQRQQR